METPKVELLRQAMATYALRAKAHAANIANLDTPGYQRLSVSFEDQLQERLTSVPGADRLSGVTPRVEVGDGPPILEDELMELADAQMRTQLGARALREHFDLVRTGITGRPQ